MGHTTVIAKAGGATAALREGVKLEGGKLDELQSGVIEASDHIWIYPDTPLLTRLTIAYPDLATRENVLIIKHDQLDEWYDAVRNITLEKLGSLPE
jgi:hypothetical protein